jgi:hypothetical protein
MQSFLPALVIASMLTTLSIVVIGVITMIRGGEFNRRNSNKLMRARVIMQGVTIVLLLIWIASR